MSVVRIFGSGLLLVAVTAGAQAQQSDSTRRDSLAQRLPDLSVNALRQGNTSIFSVPLAITRVGPRDMFGARGFSLDEAIGRIPGVLAQSRYGTSDIRLVIRGFGARGAGDRSNAGTSRGIRVLLDGFPETEPDGRTSFDGIDLAAASSIEVVRSNATTLWGNAAGGVVNISTIPYVRTPHVESQVMFGGFGLERYSLQGTGPLGDNGVVSATVVRTVFGGWRDHSNADRWLADGVASSQVGTRGRLGVFLMASDNSFRIPGPLTQAQVDADPSQANATYAGRDERRWNRLGRLGSSFEYDFRGGGSLSAMLYVNPKYLQRSERGTFRDFTRYHIGGNAVYQQRVEIGGGRQLGLMGGMDEAYQDGAIQFYSLSPTQGRGSQLQQNKREGANNLGLFAQGSIDLDHRWALTLGARYDAITYYYQDYVTPKLDDNKAFARVTPKIGLNYRVSPTHSFYANVGGGVEAPAGNETDPAGTFGQDTITAINPLLDPIRSTTYELGTKQFISTGAGFVNGVGYDVALYRTNVRNEIVPYRGGRFYFTAGKVRRSGAELGLTVNTRPGVGFQGGLTWSDHKYSTYQVDSVHYNTNLAGHFADFAGNRVVGVPEWMYNMSMSVSPRSLNHARFQVGLQGTSSYFADDANAVRVGGMLLVSATAGLDEVVSTGPMTLRGFVSVNNLFNRRYIGSAFLNPDVVNGVPVAFEPGLPRSFVVSFSLGWGRGR